jgi:hypothetical protein
MGRVVIALAVLAASSITATNSWAIGCVIEPSPINCTGRVYNQPLPNYSAPAYRPTYTPPSLPSYAPLPAHPFPVYTPNGDTTTFYPNYRVGEPSGRCAIQDNGNGGYILRC